jgi:hypothetical protein
MARVCTKRGVVLTAAVMAAVSGMAGGVKADDVRIVAKVGEMVPGGNGQAVRLNRFTGFVNTSIPLVSNTGHVLYTAEVTGTGVLSANNRGLWRAGADGTTQLVARLGSGAWAPSTSLTFSALASPMINANGMCAFLGTLAGTGVTTYNSRSFWCFNGSGSQMLVRESEDAVGFGTGVGLGTISEPEWVRSGLGGGLLLFKSALTGTGVTASNNRAIWADGVGANNSVALARAGYAIDEIPSLTCKDPYRITNGVGQAMMYATLMGNGIVTASPTGAPVVANDQIIWAPGASTYLVRAGDLVPGTGGSRKFGGLFSTTTRKPQLNNAGHLLFAPALCDGTGAVVGSGLWSNRSGSLRPVVSSGDPAPGSAAVIGSPVATVATSSFAYALCDNDAVVFVSLLEGAGVSYGSNRAIFRSNPDGTLQMLARGGTQAPGAPDGVIISNDSIARCWRVNGRGDIAFLAVLVGPGVSDTNDVGVFSTVGGQLRMLAREGDAVPQSGGWSFASMIPEPLIYFNARGQLLFPSGASGGPTGVGGTSGWFRADENGEVRAIALGGEILPEHVNPALRMSTMLPTSPLSFSDEGEVVFYNSLGAGSMIDGASVGGDAIVSIKIRPAAAVTTGACCTGTTCTVTTGQACLGSFGGVSTTCDFPGNPVTCCPVNFNASGGVDVQDLFDFLAAYFALTPSADFNHNGDISVEDIFNFFADFFAGCPQ